MYEREWSPPTVDGPGDPSERAPGSEPGLGARLRLRARTGPLDGDHVVVNMRLAPVFLLEFLVGDVCMPDGRMVVFVLVRKAEVFEAT
ncbi:MAG: hypothetical protein ACLPUG_18050 [Acidimicrobiales bacterium]